MWLFSSFPRTKKFWTLNCYIQRKGAALTAKYTPQETQTLLDLYLSGTKVEEIATTLNKSTRSVVAKLSRMDVYRSTDPKPRQATRQELVEGLEDHLTLNRGSLSSMTKMDRGQIALLVEQIVKPQ